MLYGKINHHDHKDHATFTKTKYIVSFVRFIVHIVVYLLPQRVLRVRPDCRGKVFLLACLTLFDVWVINLTIHDLL